jgi:chemotaxis signal transduction protein
MSTPSQSAQHYLPVLTFRVAERQCALPVSDVLEVMAMVEITTLPDAPPALLGLANRHGEILPVLDVRQVFGHKPTVITLSTLFIVAQQGAQRVGLVVDEVYRVHYLNEAQVRPAQGGRYVTRVASDGDTLWQIITLSALLETYPTNQQHSQGG